MSNYDFFIKIQKQSDGERQTIEHNDAGTSEYLEPKSKKVTKKGRRKRGREEGRKGGKNFNPSLKYYTRINSIWIMDLIENYNTI